MADHLEEARRLARHAGGGCQPRIMENLRAAVEHLADAIEELRATSIPKGPVPAADPRTFIEPVGLSILTGQPSTRPNPEAQ